jgi:DNA-binding sugar fermentation-stimulating protein
VGKRFFAPVQAGPGAHPTSYTMGTGSLLGVKRPGRVVDHPHPSSAEVKERVEIYLYSPSGSS